MALLTKLTSRLKERKNLGIDNQGFDLLNDSEMDANAGGVYFYQFGQSSPGSGGFSQTIIIYDRPQLLA